MPIELVEARYVQVGDQVIPEEYDPQYTFEDYDEGCAVPVLEVVHGSTGLLGIRVADETWWGEREQQVMVVRAEPYPRNAANKHYRDEP